MRYERQLIPLGGSTISLVDVGSGPAVILGFGFLCDADLWAAQIDILATRDRVIVPELWGHGLSGPLPADTSSICEVARQYLGLLDVLRIEQCALIGLSMGGMWGAELALMAPERVGALVLLDTSLAAEPAASRAAYLRLLELIEQSRAFPEPVIAAAAPLFFVRTREGLSSGVRSLPAPR